MKLSSRYNRVNLVISLLVLLLTGIIYYFLIHLILNAKLDKDLEVEEEEIIRYAAIYKKLPLPGNYLDQQVSFKELHPADTGIREFKNTVYKNEPEHVVEPGRGLVTSLDLNGKTYEVTIIKSRLESEGLVRMILLITLAVTGLLLFTLFVINRFILSQLWKPFYAVLDQMKSFNLVKSHQLQFKKGEVDEFDELFDSANLMALRVQQDYKELKNFTDSAAHEMMTPLAIIRSKLDTLLQTGEFNDKQYGLLDDVYRAINRTSRLNQSLLLLTKIENKQLPESKIYPMHDLLQEKARQFEELFEKKNLRLDLDINPTSLVMSRYLADIFFNNLLSNAVRHNYQGGRVWVKSSGDFILIGNTGRSEELDEKHFQRFYKAADSEGTGLGLAICLEISVQYGYKFTYEMIDGNHTFKLFNPASL
ncbi:histidine kinase [Pedobacter antarcticus 4BY]|uniref:histidine kinase n=2 Tax=Pedobacter antarcticus TaxID=34086 RepID=A0A081PHZ7_9SPHI|nr:HAMP domain-containing sensor histidine kinase [Pedobacter antarcticus]KEQ30320.1 histidine kinase [Pedobacter antarcticus 4BY]SFE33022.1 Signal transduction histidine kinase [Pedobacter antarcticus]